MSWLICICLAGYDQDMVTTDEERAKLQAKDAQLRKCPGCGRNGMFTPDDTIEYGCGSQREFKARWAPSDFLQTQRCVDDGGIIVGE